MSALADVKSYMEFWGWTNGGAPGSVKHDDEQRIVARYGDTNWIADVDKACATLGRLQAQILGKSVD